MLTHRLVPPLNYLTRAALLAGITMLSTYGGAGSVYADNYAYMGTGNAAPNFGVVDMTTGAFSPCGAMPTQLSGLGVGPDHQLYGGEFQGSTFYKIDPTDGSLTAVGTSTIAFWDTGSTTTSVYAVGTDSNLYSIDYASGAATLIGPTGLTVAFGSWWGMSTGSRSLYLTNNATLYRLDLSTGTAKLIGTANQGQFGADVLERGTMFAGSISPLSIFSLDTKTGAATLVSNLTGTGVGNPWGLAPISERRIKQKNICAAHKIP